MIVLDTNVYIDAGHDRTVGARVADLIATSGDTVGLSSVVLAELLIGAASADERRRVVAATVGVTEPGNLLTPTHADWRAAGDALAALGGSDATRGRSFWNDLLIAASCARAGAMLVTRNVDDFRRIQRVLPFAVTPRPE